MVSFIIHFKYTFFFCWQSCSSFISKYTNYVSNSPRQLNCWMLHFIVFRHPVPQTFPMTFKQEFKVYSSVHFYMCDYQSIYNVTTPGDKIFLYNYNFCMLFISGLVFSKERISNIWEATEVPWTLVYGYNFVSKLLQNTAVIQYILNISPVNKAFLKYIIFSLLWNSIW